MKTSSNDGAFRSRNKPFGLGREVPLAAAWHIRKRSEGRVTKHIMVIIVTIMTIFRV